MEDHKDTVFENWKIKTKQNQNDSKKKKLLSEIKTI